MQPLELSVIGDDEDEDGDERGGDHESMVRVPIRDVAGRSYGTGKRKTAVARVWLAPGSGEHKVNGKPFLIGEIEDAIRARLEK